MRTLSPKTYLILFVSLLIPIFAFNPWIPWLILKILAALAVFAAVLWCTFQTLDMLNAFNIQWVAAKKESIVSDAVRKQRQEYRKSTYPKGYPAGWYPLCWSHEVKRGEVIQRNALGKSFAIFRGDLNGEVGVLDAYCPHLGSNLAVGGTVCNDQLRCPFHLWSFDKEGKCTNIPYLKSRKMPSNANATAYPSTEYHDMICVYFGGPLPWYHLPIQEDLLDSTKYHFVGSLDYGSINMHIQEFAENAADWMHFSPIHGRMMIPFTQIEIPLIHKWLTIHHDPDTHVGGGKGKDSEAIKLNGYGPDGKHFLYFVNRSHLQWNGQSIPNSHGNACITFCGPAGICIFRFTIPAVDPDAEIMLFHTHLPLDEMNLRVRFHWYASKRLPKLLVWYVVGNWISQWTNDIMIWENKILLNKPCLVKGDGPIFKVRRWWRQFYPKQDQKEKKKEKERESESKKVVVEQEMRKSDGNVVPQVSATKVSDDGTKSMEW